jgi:hypothetical protein
MIRWHCDVPLSGGENNAGIYNRISTRSANADNPWKTGKFINEYADYIQQVPSGQAGKLHVSESENSLTTRRRPVAAAKAMNIPLIVKRSGNNLYFWRENGGEEQPRPRRGRRRRRPRMGSPGGVIPLPN